MTVTRSRAVDHIGFIRRTLSELSGYTTLAFELIQNADDTGRASALRFDVRDDGLWVEDDGGFSDCGDQDLDPDDCPYMGLYGHRCDFHSFRLLSGADKRLRDDTTGAFGIGFTAVYQITDRPEILSGCRHWSVDETAPEDERIVEDALNPPFEGTRVVLPWARDPGTEFRRRVNAPAVPTDVQGQLLAALDEAIAPATLFLRNLDRIEVAVAGDVVRVVTRRHDDGVLVIDDSGTVQRWRLLTGTFSDRESELRAFHGDLIEDARKSSIAVAIPVGFDIDGRLCATLPTARPSELPVHVNAEFYLSSDRKQLAMGAHHQADWNTAAIEGCAALLAGAVAELPGLLGAPRLWAAFHSAREIERKEHPDAVGDALGAFWRELEPKLTGQRVVFAADGRWVTIPEARYGQFIEDESADRLVLKLGIPLVDPTLRPAQNILRAVGVDYLALVDIIDALAGLGLDEVTPIAELPAPLDDPEQRARLWAQLGRMVARLRTDEARDEARDELERAAVVPSAAGDLVPIDAVWRTDRHSAELLEAAAPGFPLLDTAALPRDAEPLAALCDQLDASGALAQLRKAAPQLDRMLGRKLLDWFAAREDEFAPNDDGELAKLRIFPSADGKLHALDEVALPGDFEDPLHLALLLDADTVREHGGFLDRLGASALSFETYASEQIPRALAGQLPVGDRRAVVSLLAQRQGQLKDVPRVREILSQVDLVETSDGGWHLAEDVYFDSAEVRSVLGRGRLLAVIPTEHTDAIREFLTWLGVSDQPRPDDVLAAVTAVCAQPVTSARRTAVNRIVDWLGRRWVFATERERERYGGLKEIAWLPARDSDAWHRPGQLDLVFRDYLYEYQGLFVDLSYQVQQRGVDFLRWLGVKENPTVAQVVRHLLRCAELDTDPNIAVYTFLDDNADDDALSELEGERCLHIDDDWYRPDELFWSDHQFGRWRLRLGHDFRRFQRLLDRLGVREAPAVEDALEVIDEVSERYAPANSEVLDEDQAVLLTCWRMCEAALIEGALAPTELHDLSGRKVIADSRGVLVAPRLLYFEDLPGLAQELGGINMHVIRRPEGAWRAMQAAGVRDLSKIAVARVVHLGDRVERPIVADRIADREEALARVIDPRTSRPWQRLFGELAGLSIVEAREMSIAWELDAFGRRFAGEPRDADALWMTQEEELFVVVGDDGPVWEAVGRELVRALLPDIEPATLAFDIAAALRPDTAEGAQRALDAAGFASLADEIRADISSDVAAGLDAVEQPTPDSEAWDEPDGAEEDESPELETDVHDDEGRENDYTDEPPVPVGAATESDESDQDEERHEAGAGDRRSPAGSGANGREPLSSDRRRERFTGPRSRLRSYVLPGGSDGDTDGQQDSAGTDAVDEAGIAAVEEFERAAHRAPEVQEHNNPGFDVISYHDEEHEEVARYIEVKSTEGAWDTLGVGMSDTQFSHAERIGEDYWLYVVEYALDDERRRIWPINDPAGLVDQFMFDDGWKDAADVEGSRAFDASVDPAD